MKNQLLILAAIAVILFSCQSKESEILTTPLSEQILEFEIYDSLVVDYLGNVTLMDISPDEKSYLLVDQNTDTFLMTDKTGAILHKYKLMGEGPNNYNTSRMGVAKFLSDDSFLVPTLTGLFKYSLNGDLIQKYNPEFTGIANLLIPASESHFVKDNKVYFHLPGRDRDLGQQGLDFQAKAKLIEVVDLNNGTYEDKIPFPMSSKVSSTTAEFGAIDFYPNLALGGNNLYVAFRNEPKIFSYSLTDIDSAPTVLPIPIENFVESDTDKAPENGGFNIRNFFLGTINTINYLGEGSFLINYLAGLSDDEADQVISEAATDFDKMFKAAQELNKGGMILFDGVSISPIIEKPEILGFIYKVVSKDEIWFSLNFSEAENDYSVIYKTRLVQK
jgi:hypothetical protein